MIIDMHVHFAGRENDNWEVAQKGENIFYNRKKINSYWKDLNGLIILYQYRELEKYFKYLHKKYTGKRCGKHITSEELFITLFHEISSSEEIDGAVILGLDAVFQNGEADQNNTLLYIPDRFLADGIDKMNRMFFKSGSMKRVYHGASVHPQRSDWLEKLDEAKQRGAVLIKWIPSVQKINLKEVPEAFYRKVAELNIPLLIHTGVEHTFPGLTENDHRLSHFRNLDYPLNHGVRVIVAHCNSHIFETSDKKPYRDFDHYRDGHRLLLQYIHEKRSEGKEIVADSSALSSPAGERTRILQEIAGTGNLENSLLYPDEFLVHGSDYPIEPGRFKLPLFSLPPGGYKLDRLSKEDQKKLSNIVKTANLFDRDIGIKRMAGFSDHILENGARFLRIQEGSRHEN